jgi:hypothetical protein
MRWNNAERDDLPAHNEEVLICVNGVYYITIYNSIENNFYLKEEPDTFFTIGKQSIYWTQFESPSDAASENMINSGGTESAMQAMQGAG